MLVVLLSLPLSVRGEGEHTAEQSVRTWHPVAALTAAEQALVDLRTDTPRDPQVTYLPAERYPFAPPYSAEEMGYRAMEFSHSPRWSCNLFDVAGIQGGRTFKTYSPIFYLPNATGLSGYVGALYGTEPGQPTRRILIRYTEPAEQNGNEALVTKYRTDPQNPNRRLELTTYTTEQRRIRHLNPSVGDQLSGSVETFDDVFGRDPWAFRWELVGTDVLVQTIRFPSTRPTVTLAHPDGTFYTVPTKSLRSMGDQYPFYTSDGGVRCWVVKARVREDWLPNYYAPTILYWLDQHFFYPLRIEQYDRTGALFFIETRLATLLNPAMEDKGYGVLFDLYWDIRQDLMSYSVHDSHEVKQWSAQERQRFSLATLTREWPFTPQVSQAEVPSPTQFFLRPTLDREKFPQERSIVLSPELEAKIREQEASQQRRTPEE
jgi:hypothetical protein